MSTLDSHIYIRRSKLSVPVCLRCILPHSIRSRSGFRWSLGLSGHRFVFFSSDWLIKVSDKVGDSKSELHFQRRSYAKLIQFTNPIERTESHVVRFTIIWLMLRWPREFGSTLCQSISETMLMTLRVDEIPIWTLVIVLFTAPRLADRLHEIKGVLSSEKSGLW